jgi:hypothetical protein
MKILIKKFNSAILLIILTSSIINAQNVVKKVRLLVMMNTRSPLYVAYKSEEGAVAARVMSLAFYATTGVHVPGSYPPMYVQNKTFQETIGNFYRHPIVRDSLIRSFKPVSEYFIIDVGEDHGPLKDTHAEDFYNRPWLGYDFVLFIDEVNAGLLTTELGTVSTSTYIRYELYNVASKESLDKGNYTFVTLNKRAKEVAISDRETFVKEYPIVVHDLFKSLYLKLSYTGKLHKMAETQGLGAFVPTYEYYYNLYRKRYTLKVSSPAGWDVGEYPRSQSKFVNPRDRFPESKIVHGRVDVFNLIKDMKEITSLEKFANDFISKKLKNGFTNDETTQVDISLKPDDIKFILNGSEGEKYLFIIRRFKNAYAVTFQFKVNKDFTYYIQHYKKDIEAIMAHTKVRV